MPNASAFGVSAQTPRRPDLDILAISCPLEQKRFLIEAAPLISFDDDHSLGYPAVLAPLAEIDNAELIPRLQTAYDFQAARPPERRRPR